MSMNELERALRMMHSPGFPFHDAYVLDGDLHVEFALAGYSKEDITIIMESGTLTVKGKKKDQKEKKDSKEWIARNIKSGDFETRYSVGIKYCTAPEATFTDGILRLVFKVAEDQKPKTIAIG